MGLDILFAIVSGVASLVVGGVASAEVIQKILRQIFPKIFVSNPPATESYGERLNKLTSGLTKASEEVDRVLIELAGVARDREKAVRELESDLSSLEQQEKELKQRIETLEKVPLPVVDQFARLVESGERRSAKRDYLLFGAGVLVSTVITVVFKLAGWG